jgi:hypothetical protein
MKVGHKLIFRLAIFNCFFVVVTMIDGSSLKEELERNSIRSVNSDEQSPVAGSLFCASGRTHLEERPVFPNDEQTVSHCIEAISPCSGSSSSDQLRLTQLEIDAICSRKLDVTTALTMVSSSPSTPDSLHSHPDFFDPRPDIYRFAYNISPASRTSLEDSNVDAIAPVADENLLPDVQLEIANHHGHETMTNEECCMLDSTSQLTSDSKPHGMQKFLHVFTLSSNADSCF